MKILYLIHIASAVLCPADIPCDPPPIAALSVDVGDSASFLYLDPSLEYPVPLVTASDYEYVSTRVV